MAPPIYFFPNEPLSTVVQDDRPGPVFARLGLDRTFTDVVSTQRQCWVEQPTTGAGPGGHPGTFFCALQTARPRPARLGYYPEHQEWREFHAPGGAFWAASDRGDRIAPEDLARSISLAGDCYVCQLPSGRWRVPVIRDPDGGTGLPCDWPVDLATGRVVPAIKAAYRETWDLYGEVVDHFFDPDKPASTLGRTDPAAAIRWCLAALAIHYRVGLVEQNLMGIVDAETWFTIASSAVDLPTRTEVWKAVEASRRPFGSPTAPPDTSPGPPAESPTTDRAGPN